jgi:hypothetical protein
MRKFSIALAASMKQRCDFLQRVAREIYDPFVAVTCRASSARHFIGRHCALSRYGIMPPK